MLPGKKYTPEDYVRIVWTRKWLIIIPALLFGAGAFVYSQSLPDRFRSTSTVLVIPQRVPEDFVRSTVTDTVTARLNSISQQILSRTRLERIIEEFNLYERERETMLMEDIVEQMRRRDIRVDIVQSRGRRDQEASSFTVGFESSNPRTAMQVTERLASMFVQENLEGRELLADSTSQFLQAQLDEARRRLVDHEAKLEAFRRENAGRLPSQLQSNLQMLQTTQVQLQANVDAANQERDRLAMLEATIAEAIAGRGGNTAAPADGATGTAAQQLESARAGLRALELRLKPEHPDVIRARRVVEELEVKADAEALTAAVSPTSTPVVVTGEARGRADRLTELQLEAQEIRARLENRKQEDARLQAMMASYTARLEAAPGLESELTELTRDYATLESQYTALLNKSEAANMAVNLERRQVGEQFRVIDAARLPQRPTSPDRTRTNLIGLAAGLGLGLALVALLEYRDTRLRTDDDVVISLALPVLAVIPLMITSGEQRQIRRRKLLYGLSGSVATVLVIGAILLWRMDILQAWVR